MKKLDSEEIKKRIVYGFRILFFGWLGAISVLCAAVVIVFCFFSVSSLPSDDELISQFQNRKPILHALLAMSNEDEDFSRITRGYLEPKFVGDMPKDRWQSYRELFDSSGLKYGIERSDNNDVFFVASTNLAGDAKGYAHLSHPPEQLVSSLKDLSPFGFWHDNSTLGGGPAYRKLQDDWYLYRTIHF